jgi:hypothetical protein
MLGGLANHQGDQPFEPLVVLTAAPTTHEV